MREFTVLNPNNEQVLFTKPYANPDAIDQALSAAKTAQKAWKDQTLQARIQAVESFVQALLKHEAEICTELASAIGRPISQVPGELKGMAHRARYMMQIAPEVLKADDCEQAPWQSNKPSFNVQRSIHKNPVGTVLIIAPWNYPFLTVINGLVPALLAGNAVLLKHAPQTAQCGARIALAASESNLPPHIIQALDMHPDDVAPLIETRKVQAVSFTGSVSVGQHLHRLASQSMLPINLELGGNDAAWVLKDADIPWCAEQLASGAFYNSGQSCCSVERIFVDASCYEDFVEALSQATQAYVPDSSLEPSTNLGPVVNKDILERCEQFCQNAKDLGATLIRPQAQNCPSNGFFLAPTIIKDANLDMQVLQQESFGPIVACMPIQSNLDAIEAINHNPYGLSASIWTQNPDQVAPYLHQIEAGTIFVNQCDMLDPSLPWIGIKNSGKGCSLSKYGFETFVQKQSHFIRFPN